jgi:hypothetical protein
MLYQQWSYFIIATKPCQLYPVYHRNLSYLQSYRNPAVFRLVKYPLLLAVISVLTTELRTLAGLVVLCNSIETKREVERHPEVQNNFLIAGNLPLHFCLSEKIGHLRVPNAKGQSHLESGTKSSSGAPWIRHATPSFQAGRS